MGRALLIRWKPLRQEPQPCCGGRLEAVPAGLTTPCLPALPREAAHPGSTPASWLPWFKDVASAGLLGAQLRAFLRIGPEMSTERPLDGEGWKRERREGGQRETQKEK